MLPRNLELGVVWRIDPTQTRNLAAVDDVLQPRSQPLRFSVHDRDRIRRRHVGVAIVKAISEGLNRSFCSSTRFYRNSKCCRSTSSTPE